mmetsp:Transcript_10003/g.28028  ORF Transcript_10003/g.28028 Transcript_10003/m.28028 type:complete len:258 (+) Transcript_10003:128-901(+)
MQQQLRSCTLKLSLSLLSLFHRHIIPLGLNRLSVGTPRPSRNLNTNHANVLGILEEKLQPFHRLAAVHTHNAGPLPHCLRLSSDTLGGNAQHLLQYLRGRRIDVLALEVTNLLPVGGHHHHIVIGIVLLGFPLADEVPRRQRRRIAVGTGRLEAVGFKVGHVVDQRPFRLGGRFLRLGLGRLFGRFVQFLERHERDALGTAALHLGLTETVNDALLGGGNLNGPHQLLRLLRGGHLDPFPIGGGGKERIVDQPPVPR